MKVIFHIGSAKTGTSSIQQFLSHNRAALLERGILYPRLPGHANNQKILAVPLWDHVQRTLVRRLGPDIEAARDEALKAWGRVRRQVREHRPDVVLISSEFFFADKRIEHLGELVQTYFGDDVDLEFIAYLRRPSEFYASSIQQNFNGSHELKPLAPQPLASRLDRYATLGRMTVRAFDRTRLKDGSVVADFRDAAGLPGDGLDHGDTHSNSSVSAEGAILMQDYRRAHHAERNEVLSKDSKMYRRRILREEEANPGVYTRARLKPEFAQFLDRETDDLRAVRARYGVVLARDHGVAAASEARIAALTDAAEVLEHDPALLARMRAAVAAAPA